MYAAAAVNVDIATGISFCGQIKEQSRDTTDMFPRKVMHIIGG